MQATLSLSSFSFLSVHLCRWHVMYHKSPWHIVHIFIPPLVKWEVLTQTIKTNKSFPKGCATIVSTDLKYLNCFTQLVQLQYFVLHVKTPLALPSVAILPSSGQKIFSHTKLHQLNSADLSTFHWDILKFTLSKLHDTISMTKI